MQEICTIRRTADHTSSVPSDIPDNVRKLPADVEQMRKIFEDWDPRLNSIIKETKHVFKWNLHHMEELDTWVKGSVALLGDACHPTLPYQAQGAAMAVEDGATLGKLLGLYTSARSSALNISIPAVLGLYETLRKRRTTLNVAGANQNRTLYHLGETDAQKRNKQLKHVDWDVASNDCPWLWGDMEYMRYLNGFDTLAAAELAFHEKFNTGDADAKRSDSSAELEERLLKKIQNMSI